MIVLYFPMMKAVRSNIFFSKELYFYPMISTDYINNNYDIYCASWITNLPQIQYLSIPTSFLTPQILITPPSPFFQTVQLHPHHLWVVRVPDHQAVIHVLIRPHWTYGPIEVAPVNELSTNNFLYDQRCTFSWFMFILYSSSLIYPSFFFFSNFSSFWCLKYS